MNGEPNIADLLRQLRDDTTALVREEVVLVKTELSEKLAHTSRNVGYLAVGGLIASSALLLGLTSVAHLISELFMREGTDSGMAVFLGFLIVAVIAGAVSAALITKAMKALGHDTVKPEKTVQSVREDKQWAQRRMS